MPNLTDIINSLADAMQNVGNYSAQAAERSNNVSRQAQAAQAAYNSEAMNTANSLTDNRIASQYGFNSAMMANANQYNTEAWNKTAAWNEAMWEKQAQFNAEQAQIQRDWQERMANTQYQRAVNDMSKAGLNPILAVNGGGVGTSIPGGATASVGGASMSSAQSQMASGGLVGAESSSISNFSGQMEYLGGTLGLLAAFFSSLSSAEQVGENAVNAVNEYTEDYSKKLYKDTEAVKLGDKSVIRYALDHRPGSMAQDILSKFLGLDTGEKKNKYHNNAVKSEPVKTVKENGGYTEKNWYFDKPLK